MPSISELFEGLARRGLTREKAREVLQRADIPTVYTIVEELQNALPVVESRAVGAFNFVANSPLSGAPYPCSGISCRGERMDQLARFSALYAESVLIHNPFPRYFALSASARVFASKLLADELQLLYHLRPLLEDGTIAYANTVFNLCPQHGTHLVADKPELVDRLTKVNKDLLKRFHTEARFVYDKDADRIRISGPEELIEHGRLSFVLPHKDVVTGKRRDSDGRPEVIGRTRKAILQSLVDPIIEDVLVQSVYSEALDYSYLTDREADLDVLAAAHPDATREINRALVDNLTHEVPFVGAVQLDRLVALRKAEGEAFRVYRDALRKVVREAQGEPDERVREALRDVVVPEINRIDLAVKNARKLLRDSLAVDAVVAGGLVTVGLFSGLLTGGAASVVAAAGGVKAIFDGAKQVAKLGQVDASARESPFYFLWRVHREGRRLEHRPVMRP